MEQKNRPYKKKNVLLWYAFPVLSLIKNKYFKFEAIETKFNVGIWKKFSENFHINKFLNYFYVVLIISYNKQKEMH